jgi:hypothetical protein
MVGALSRDAAPAGGVQKAAGGRTNRIRQADR